MKLHGDMDANIILLVRDVLGCTCPDEVFEKISHYGCKDPLDGLNIQIGDRLLVLVKPVVPGSEKGDRQSNLERAAYLLNSGRKARDSMGYNRYRLVLVAMEGVETGELEKMAEEAYRKFEERHGPDEKVHIHALSIDDLDGELQGTIRKFARMR